MKKSEEIKRFEHDLKESAELRAKLERRSGTSSRQRKYRAKVRP